MDLSLEVSVSLDSAYELLQEALASLIEDKYWEPVAAVTHALRWLDTLLPQAASDDLMVTPDDLLTELE